MASLVSALGLLIPWNTTAVAHTSLFRKRFKTLMRTSLLRKSTPSILKENYEIAAEIGRHVAQKNTRRIKRISGRKPWPSIDSYATFAISHSVQAISWRITNALRGISTKLPGSSNLSKTQWPRNASPVIKLRRDTTVALASTLPRLSKSSMLISRRQST
jgi:hypothetical protein